MRWTPRACGRRARASGRARSSTPSPTSGGSSSPPARPDRQPLGDGAASASRTRSGSIRAPGWRGSPGTPAAFSSKDPTISSSAFRRIDEDNQFHYLLTYAPSNDAFDGRFRAIRVKVARSGCRSSRAKVPGRSAAPGRVAPASYEAPALALLDRAPLPNAFPVQAAGFSFPDPARPGLTPILVHVSTASLRFDVDAERSSYAGRAAIVVPLRDGNGPRGPDAQPAVPASRERRRISRRRGAERSSSTASRSGPGRLHDGVDRASTTSPPARQRPCRDADGPAAPTRPRSA